jgi:hypothetical protein
MIRTLTVISCLLLVLGSTWAQTKAPLPDDQQRQLLAIIRQGNVEQMKAMLKAKNEAYPAKSLLILMVEEVYTCAPGPGAGDRIA